MTATRQTLLQNAAKGGDQAWDELVNIYQPLIFSWLARNGVTGLDCDEITQEVMIVVHRKIADFTHSGNQGAFRKWLRTITLNQVRTYLRKNSNKPRGLGGSTFLQQIENLGDDNSAMSQAWDREHDQAVINGILKHIQKQLDEKTILIFKKLVLEEADPNEVAKAFDVSVGSVYSSKSRVMRKIRQLGSDLLDASYF